MRTTKTFTIRAVVPLALGLAAALVLTACGSSGSSSSSNPSSGSKSTGSPTGRELKLSFLQDPGQPPDPDVFYGSQGLILTTNMYEGLLTYAGGTATPTLQPSLATAWTESADHKTFTFQLRKNVTFHDGTPFTAAAIKASFDRRTAVNSGPAYMVSDVASVTTQGDYAATVTLKQSDAAFLAYLASPYGPKMMSPTALAANAGSDHDQTYLQTHDVGTGPYELATAKVGTDYALKSYAGYWGAKPYFTSVDLPVLADASAQQLQFKSGELAALLHDIPSSAVKSYLSDSKISAYNLPTMMSDYLYINPNRPVLADQKTRQALQQAINLDTLVTSAYFGRGTKASQVYAANMMAPQYAKQSITYDPSVLKGIVANLPSDEKTVTVGYDSSSTDNQQVANLIAVGLQAAGLTAKVAGYPTSQIFGWVGNAKGAPDMLANLGWPDAPPPYAWAHINFDPDGGVNLLKCSSPATTALIAQGKGNGSDQVFSDAAESALATGCWLNLVDVSDFMVAQPWLKGVEQAHIVAYPNTLMLAKLSA